MKNAPRILFYVEVFTELGKPHFHESWIEFSARLMAGMMEAGHPATPDMLRLVTNENLAELCPKYGFWNQVTTISENEFLNIFQTDYLTATVAGYHGSLDDSTVTTAGNYIRDAVGSFEPDIIITYSTAPWLQSAYPYALILHKEYGAFSRPPFPESFYLDPNGKFARSTLAKNADDLASIQASDAERKMLETIRSVFCDEIIRQNSPFTRIEELIRQKYKKILLLPLQFSGHYGFDGTGKYLTQDELVCDVIENIDPDIGVLVINHSTAYHHGTTPSLQLYNRLNEHHDNLFFNNDFNKIVHPSQFLLAHVDIVATVSSSVGLQAMLWDKSFVALGDSHINAVADYTNITDLSAEDDAAPRWDKTGALSWLLTHYYIPESYYRKGEWSSAFLERSLSRWQRGKRGLDFFDPIDTPEAIATNMINNADRDVPLTAVERS